MGVHDMVPLGIPSVPELAWVLQRVQPVFMQDRRLLLSSVDVAIDSAPETPGEPSRQMAPAEILCSGDSAA